MLGRIKERFTWGINKDVGEILFEVVEWMKKSNSVALSPRANYTDWATATCWRNIVPTFVDRRVSRGQRGGSPTVVNLCFLDGKMGLNWRKDVQWCLKTVMNLKIKFKKRKIFPGQQEHIILKLWFKKLTLPFSSDLLSEILMSVLHEKGIFSVFCIGPEFCDSQKQKSITYKILYTQELITLHCEKVMDII
jgi:hypothetical protein